MKKTEESVEKSIFLVILSIIFVTCVLLLNFDNNDECKGSDCNLLDDELMHNIDMENVSIRLIDDDIQEYILPLNDEEVIFFINSSNSSLIGSSLFLGAMYDNVILNDYKIYYSLYKVLSSASMFTELKGKLYISKDTLEKVVKVIFKDVSIVNGYSSNEKYYFLNGILCTNNICEISYERVESGGYDSTYVSKVISDTIINNKREIVVQIYFVKVVLADADKYRMIISASYGYPSLFEGEFDYNDEVLKNYHEYDANSSLFELDKPLKYKFVFNSENQLESVFILEDSTIIELR